MEVMELEPRVKPLSYKIKGMSREAPSQKALHVLDTDLRSHWSTGTSTKEWILLELDEPCLLSRIRIYNKSVLEWEIAAGLRYKPESFVKVRPRCEAPRRDMTYPMNYTPCRYVRISCLRGSPIAIFYIQLIGVSVPGLEPEFQPVVNYLLPHIISHKQGGENLHLQLLQDITNRLLPFLPQLEAELTNFTEAAESNMRFFAMLAGPFYPILYVINEREATRTSCNFLDSDASKNTLPPTLTVSSNFEVQPRKLRSPSSLLQPASSLVFRPDTVFMLLRRGYTDPHLGSICRMFSGVLRKLIEPSEPLETPVPSTDLTSTVSDETSKAEASNYMLLADYSSLFGEELKIPEDHWDPNYANVLDISTVEEGVLHVLYACASQPLLCHKLAESSSEYWCVLPLVQALLPALRPPVTGPSDHVEDGFSQWKHPFVQQSLCQIVATSSSSVYRPLLCSCSGYLASFSPSHRKAACVLIDLCSGPLAPWISVVIAKIDLAIELLQELLGIIQGARTSISWSRAALKYIVLALSGHMDDVLAVYKDAKHKVLFLVEMLESFLDPAVTAAKNTIAFGDVSSIFLEKQEQDCAVALNVIRTAVRKSAVLRSLESEWRRGSVASSVLLSILDPNLPLPPDIDLCVCPVTKVSEQEESVRFGGAFARPNDQEESDGKSEIPEMKINVLDDAGLFFAPPELKSAALRNLSNSFTGHSPDKNSIESNHEIVNKGGRHLIGKNLSTHFENGLVLDVGFSVEYFNLQADYLQLMNHRDCELRASEFRSLATELHSQHDITPEGHDAAIDALLLAAECYINPFFMTALRSRPKVNLTSISIISNVKKDEISVPRVCEMKCNDLEKISLLERKRDLTVLQILLEAAQLDREYQRRVSGEDQCLHDNGGMEQGIEVLTVDEHASDAVTLVRQNQALLCRFLIQRLSKEHSSMHEILMQSLLFLLHSVTELFCSPEDVIDIILGSAEYLNGRLSSFYHQLKEGNLQLDDEKVHGIQRRWIILQRLVIASSGGDEGPDFAMKVNNGFRFKNLIPPSSWLNRIPKFSSSQFPLVRFLGWMAVSSYAKQYLKERLFLVSDLTEMTSLLSIFADELALVDKIAKDEAAKLGLTREKTDSQASEGFELHERHGTGSFHIIYPDLHKFFPNLKRQFEAFGENILEAVGLQLRSLSTTFVPDMLCWFSELCLWPFLGSGWDCYLNRTTCNHLKGYAAKNAKAIILNVLEAIVVEHMEVMVPEIPRVVQVLASLCKTSYCDVFFLNSVLRLLKPLISYALKKAADEEHIVKDDSSCLNFESVCFDELFCYLNNGIGNEDGATERVYRGALTIFILGSIFPDLSFQRKRDILESLILWGGFTKHEPPSALYDYLCAFQKVMDSCRLVLVKTLKDFNLSIPVMNPQLPVEGSTPVLDDRLGIFGIHDGICDQFEGAEDDEDLSGKKVQALQGEEIDEFCKCLDGLISKLYPTIELCWKLHSQLAKKLTVTLSRCYMYFKCLSSLQNFYENEKNGGEDVCPTITSECAALHWRSGLEGLGRSVLRLLENRCWQVGSTMIDYLLGLPPYFCLDNVLGYVCSAVKHICCHAPTLEWRLQTDKWLLILVSRGISSLHENESSFLDMFSTMLAHPEPEQRSVALQQLGRLVGKDATSGASNLSYKIHDIKLTASDLSSSVSESVLSLLVSNTWDRVTLLASSDPSMVLRLHAMGILVDYVPFAERSQLQSFLGASDTVLHGLGRLAYSVCESPLTHLSLSVLASACLYSPAEDISLIPQNVWRNLDILATSKSGRLGDLEKRACQALCNLRTEVDDAKEVLKEVLSTSTSTKDSNPDFGSTRESILQVLADLTSVRSFYDVFSKKVDREAMELEEAEIEMDLLQKERALQELSGVNKDETQQIPLFSTQMENNKGLQQIKDSIRSLEKSMLREEIAARRQKKLLVQRARQKFLEEAALRESELLQELDRERTTEVEREIERQRVLELERAKTRELRHNLDMEKERQTQRELQRELEQAESGLTPSRREFSSTPSGRQRDRYRDRENGRSGHEGGIRSSSTGRESGPTSQTPIGGASSNVASIPTVVLGGGGSRQFSSQLPTILQSRDRPEERGGGSYEDNFEGSRDSGDTGSVGDSDTASAFDGQAGGFGSGQRNISRGSKSRQLVERREREGGGRREGKWERKHS
ncbi:uncharacterized protein LOC113301683 isoform X2 [Papaver somniferum]|uniref:uncharacterized protein LOC113301683 isoform X2 n=1 Tax=Papaver somniferum TaxID=3469 RepID=UPI000E6F9CA9|nr:uncharacterized protein LOC113301683 isoform X2 [Papaver somniferum]